MSLLKDLAPEIKLYPCKVRTLIQSMTKEDAEILTNAINNAELWPARTLQNALQTRGVVLSDITIGRHRKNQCSCVG